MTLKIQIVIIVVALLAIVMTFYFIKKGKLGLKIVMPWLIVFLLVLIFAAVPKFMNWAAGVIGIYDPVNMVFFLAIIFLTLIIYGLTMSLYETKKQTRDVIQKVAYLEEKLKEKSNVE